MNGTIFDIKEMAVHDGSGIRTTVFLKGCPLRCIWCHNPEGLSSKPQLMFKEARCLKCNLCFKPCNHPECKPYGRCLHICPQNCLSITGKTVSDEDLKTELVKGADILGDSFGGFTFSGGEPLMQSEFLIKMLDNLKNYNLCIETCGYTDGEIFKSVIDKLQFVIMDIKIADSKLHKEYTGVSNEKILKNFEILKNSGKPYTIRTPLIPNITDTEDNLIKIKEIIGNSNWEQLPYNAAAGAKYKMLGMKYELKDRI